MTKIIGHRGAKGVAPENTLAGFAVAKKLGVDAIELDVRRTKDGQFVVCHDNRLTRLSGSNVTIKKLTYAELQDIRMHSGEGIPLLGDALATIGDTPVFIEIKVRHHTEEICKIVDGFPNLKVSYASFKHDVIADCVRLRPSIPTYILEQFNPFEVVGLARRVGAAGIGLRFWLINPLTYLLARRYHLKIYVYTVNWRWAARLLLRFYPGVDLCTNLPETMQYVRAKRGAGA